MLQRVIIVGGGPAGLMAAEQLSLRPDCRIEVFDAMPTFGRKFLMAGRGGLNITHSEALADFTARYGIAAPVVSRWLARFSPDDLRAWVHGLGVNTFIGTSGRVFPDEMKAAPLLRQWLARLRRQGVQFHVRQRWLGWNDAGDALFAGADEPPRAEAADALILALGGGSWARLGSDGRWQDCLAGRGIPLRPLLPANCAFIVDWSEHFRTRHAGAPVKNLLAHSGGAPVAGELNISENGIEGGLVYAHAAALRDLLLAGQPAVLTLDLAPGRSLHALQEALLRPRGRDSLSNHLRRRAGIDGVKAALLRECLPPDAFHDMSRLARGIKALPLTVRATRPIDEAISTAGGVCLDALTEGLMLKALPGVFCAGEMLDWEAPTGGYLLTACLASGRIAAAGAGEWLASLQTGESGAA